jgi:tetratricopeptide (TPR) repeat protein/predicted Ser/Thr protein kinase
MGRVYVRLASFGQTYFRKVVTLNTHALVQRIGRYKLLEKIGQGGMGSVYRAYDRLTRRQVGLKQVNTTPEILSLQSTNNDPLLALTLEFRTLASLRHPNIVTVLDYGFDGHRLPYFTMELIEGAQLFTSYASDLDMADKVRLLLEMLQALVYLHRHGIVHRDLKPANVLVDEKGSVHVMDFGLVWKHDSSGKVGRELAGTLGYMAPELFDGDPPSPASDLYAVGIMMYELFAGKHPYGAEGMAMIIYNAMMRQPDLSSVPPHLATLVDRLLSKTHLLRPQRAEDVIAELCAATDTPLPAESLVLRESFLQASAFVGRSQEMIVLLDALNQTLEGGVAFWLVGGESGVGKSRLLDELRTRAMVKGALVLRGQAVADGGLPYQLWRDGAARLILDTPISDLEAGILKPLVPEIAVMLERPIPDVPEIPGSAGRQRLALTMLDLLQRQPTPVVILLEDLQWAESNFEMIRQLLAASKSSKNLLVIGTYRDDEYPNLPDKLQGMSLLTLPRLNHEAVSELTRAMLGETSEQQDVVELLQRETEGNVFFMIETLRVLAEEAGTLEAIGQQTLPHNLFVHSIQRIIARRLERMPESLHPLLRLAAVIGRQLDLQILNKLATHNDVLSLLKIGAELRILEVVEENWRFSHDKLREGVLRMLSESERRDSARTVALAIEEVYPKDAAYHEVLLKHWTVAEDTEQILRYLLPVIDYTINLRAEYKEALHLVERGLSLVSPDDKRFIILLVRKSFALTELGDFQKALDVVKDAFSRAEQFNLHDQIAASLQRMGLVYHEIGQLADAEVCITRALQLFRSLDLPFGIASALNNLGRLEETRGNFREALAYYNESMEVNERLDNVRSLGLGKNNIGVILGTQGQFDEAEKHFLEALEIRRSIGERQGTAATLTNLGNLYQTQGRYSEAEKYFKEGLLLYRGISNMRNAGVTLINLGNVMRCQKRFATSEAYFNEGLALLRGMNFRWGIVAGLMYLALLWHETGHPELKETLIEGLELALQIGTSEFVAHLLVTSGRRLAQLENIEEAAQLAGVVEAHAQDVEVLKELTILKRELESQLPVDTLQRYMADGAELTLEEAAQKQLQLFKQD